MMMHLQQHTRNQPLYLRDGSYTSVRLEPIFFYALRLIADNRGLSMSDLIREIEGHPRNPRRSFTSALRCYVVEQLHPHYAVTGREISIYGAAVAALAGGIRVARNDRTAGGPLSLPR